jgi:hypothetical protein
VSKCHPPTAMPNFLDKYLLFQSSADTIPLHSLPFMLAIVFSAAMSGLTISLSGNYWNILVFGPWLRCLGAGLLYTLHETSPSAKYIGYQVRTFGATLSCKI